ncbi:trichohyalin, putative [Entamoeba histolytica]
MEELINKNNQLIKEGVETLPHIQHSIDGVTKNYQYYLGSIKKRKKQDEERMQRMRGIKEMRQIEEWTERRITNVIFDSDIDNWNINTSVFGQRIKGKEHLIIIIEDSRGNKFGGYVNSKIDKVGQWIYDSKSFVFSLESKGRMKRMMKFDIKEPGHAFWLDNQSNNYLFAFGWSGDILVCKENYKTISSCKQCSFEFEGISNALCGKEYTEPFTPERIIVIEMK